MRDLPKNWLVFRLSALGDVVLATGALRYWNETRGWRFNVVTKEAFASVFDNHPAVDAVIVATPHDLAAPGMYAWLTGLAVRHAGWGLLDLHGTARSRFLALRWKGPVRRYAKLGLARRAFLLTGGRAYRDALRATNVPQRYAMAVDSPPPDAEALVPELFLTERERAWGKSFLANLFPDDVLREASGAAVRPVAIHPFAAHPHKAWPETRYREVVARLDGRGIPWIVVGRGAAFFPGDPRDLTGKTTVRESAALLAACSALVTGDSGPMHLATAVGTPVIGLFGPTTGEWGFFPSGPRDRVLEKDLACRPCSLHGQTGCLRNGECLAQIGTDDVVAALEAVWSGNPDREDRS
ncbi:MAG: glycosyltransferase family 9 protein [Deltaproteobacteria bacterium]|nr:glycosyltransferase family 9 protein [Deltaproteobacteria bacterium]